MKNNEWMVDKSTEVCFSFLCLLKDSERFETKGKIFLNAIHIAIPSIFRPLLYAVHEEETESQDKLNTHFEHQGS